MLRNSTTNRKLSTALIAGFSLVAMPAALLAGPGKDADKTAQHSDYKNKDKKQHASECSCPDHKDKDATTTSNQARSDTDTVRGLSSSDADVSSTDLDTEASISSNNGSASASSGVTGTNPRSSSSVSGNVDSEYETHPMTDEPRTSARNDMAMNSGRLVDDEPLQPQYESEDDFISMGVDESRLYQADSDWRNNRVRGYAEAGVTDQPDYIELETDRDEQPSRSTTPATGSRSATPASGNATDLDDEQGSLNVEFDQYETSAYLNGQDAPREGHVNLKAEREISSNSVDPSVTEYRSNRGVDNPDQLSSPSQNPQRDNRLSVLVPAPGDRSNSSVNSSSTTSTTNRTTMSQSDRSATVASSGIDRTREHDNRDVSMSSSDLHEDESFNEMDRSDRELASQQDSEESNIATLSISSVTIEPKRHAMFVPAEELEKLQAKGQQRDESSQTAAGDQEKVYVIYMEPGSTTTAHGLSSRPLSDIVASSGQTTQPANRQQNRDVSAAWAERNRQPSDEQMSAAERPLDDEEFASTERMNNTQY